MTPQYSWQEPYFAGVLETDRSRLPQHIAQARNAIKTRTGELERDHGGTPEERAAIEDALRCLEILQKEV